jgi:hypothetical protein
LGIAVNGNGVGYVTGITQLSNFYTTPGAYQTTPTDTFPQGFIRQIDDVGGTYISTFVGGSTAATDFPGNGPVHPHPTAGLMMKFTPDLSTLLYSRQEASK